MGDVLESYALGQRHGWKERMVENKSIKNGLRKKKYL